MNAELIRKALKVLAGARVKDGNLTGMDEINEALAALPDWTADAALGRAVRAMKQRYSLHRWGECWAVEHLSDQTFGYVKWSGPTPEAALRAAGLMEEK